MFTKLDNNATDPQIQEYEIKPQIKIAQCQCQKISGQNCDDTKKII